jgi:hypothetical protein
VVQLDHLLAAEQSTELAHEDEDGGLVLPQRAEADGFAVLVEDGECGEVVSAFASRGG